MEKQFTAYLVQLASWLGDHLYLTLPLFPLLVIFVIKTKPKLFLGFLKFDAKYNDFANPQGPRLTEQDFNRLKQLKSKKQFVIDAITKAENSLRWLYDQRLMNIRGFNRALLIAFGYPIAFMLVLWLFTPGPLLLGQVQLASQVAWELKLLLVSLPVVTALIIRLFPVKLEKFITAVQVRLKGATGKSQRQSVFEKYLKIFRFSSLEVEELASVITYILAVAFAVAFAGAGAG